jgi:hypothetical protein
MLVETLITLVNARGIDLQHVAGNASNTHGIAKKRRLSAQEIKLRKELKLALSIEPTVQGANTRSSRAPRLPQAELAHALHGVPRMPELALYYSLAGWLGGFEELHRGLMLKQLQDANREKDWPLVVPYLGGRMGEPHDYVSKLATIVLVEDAHKNEFIIAPHLPFAYMGMEEAVWDKLLAGRYHQLKQQYENWYEIALGMSRRRMMAVPEVAQPVSA